MEWQFSSYIAILFLNSLLSLIVAYFALRLRDKPGGLPLGLLMLAVAEWSFALTFEATAATIPAKVFWSKIEYLGIISAPVFLLLFALEFTHREKWLQRRYLTCYWIIPIISLALSFTNEWHHLIWTSFTPIPGSNFIIYGHGSWFWIMVAYIYLILSTATILLLRAAFRLRYIYRQQAIMLFVGMFPPWLANILYVANLGPIPGCDLSPIGFALTGLLLTRSLSRLKLLDLAPVAHDKVIENMRDGVLVLDAQNRIVDINPAAQELIGVDGESAIGRHAEAILAKWTGLENRYRDAVEAQGQVFVDGVGHIEWRISPLYEGKRPSGQLITLRDVTARVRAEESLRRFSKDREEIFQAVGNATIIIDPEFNIIDANRSTVAATGKSKDELLGKRCYEIFHGTKQPPEGCPAKQIITLAHYAPVEEEMQALGGTFLVSCTPVLSDEGHLVKIIHSVTDITERKRAEEALRESEEQLRNLIDAMPDFVCFKDGEGRWLAINDACSQLFRLDGVDYRGKKDSELAKASSILQGTFLTCKETDARTWEKRSLSRGEEMIPHPDGTTRTYDVIKAPVFHPDGRRKGLVVLGRDITERVRSEEERAQAEEALRESEERFRQIAENVREQFWITNPRTKELLYVSPAYEEIWGRPSESAYERQESWLEDVYPEDRDMVLATLERQRQGHPTVVEYRIVRPDGSIRWIRNRAFPIRDAQGKLGRVTGVAEDITEHKRAEEALRQSEEKYRATFEATGTATIITEEDTTLSMVNSRFEELCGYPREEIEGKKGWTEFIARDDLEMMKEYHRLRRTAADGAPTRYEFRLIDRYGEVKDILLTLAMIPGTKKCVASLLDITERKRAEREIEERRSYLESVLISAPDAIVTLDAQHRILEWNQGAEMLFGYTLQEAAGRNIDDLVTGPDANALEEAVGLTKRILAGGSVSPAEMVRYRKDGSPVDVIASGSPILVEGKVIGVVAVYTDITEHKQMEQQLRQQERLAAVGQLAAGIAHDFNNLLTTIMLYAQMSLRRPDLPPKIVHSFETILDESRRAAELVQQILDFSRHAMLKVQSLDLGSLTGKAVDILRRTIPENIHLILETGPEDYIIEADPTRIQQALMNLATNGRDAMPEGGELRFELSRTRLKPGDDPPVAGMSPGEWVCLAVSDTGTGMTEEAQAHLFEPFFTTKEVGKGTGLGLAQVYGITRQHKGYIGVETEVGKGTTFRIYLPASEPEVKVVEKEVAAPPQGQGETILLVEDNENLLKVGQTILESLGYRVLTAANGREALAVYEAEGGVDLVITDLVMPEMGGRQLMQKLKQVNPGLKGLAITGYALQKASQELEETGFLDVIHKPFNVSTLAHIVRRALDAD